MQYTHRADIPEKYKWTLTDIYDSDSAWEAALSDIVKMADTAASFKGRLAESRETFKAGLCALEQMEQQLERVYMYARMYRDIDNGDPKRQAMYEKASGVLFNIQESTAFVIPELSAMPPETLREWANEVPDFVHSADNIIRSRPHVLSSREELLMAMAAPVIESLDSAFTMLESVDMDLGEITDENGNKVKLTHGLFGMLRDCRNRDVRRDAFESMHLAFANVGNTVATLYSGSVRADLFNAKARGYTDCLSQALFSDNLPRRVYTGLIDAVRSRLPANHRYLALRKKCLGLEKLHIYDCYAPIVDIPEKQYTYEQACDLIKEHLPPLGEAYISDLGKLLAGGWVDVYETPGKTTGAFATGIYGVHPYMLLNFAGQLGDVFTLAHEAGHCLHTWYSDKQPYRNKDYPIFLAEIASTVNENILIRGLIGRCGESDQKEKAFLLNRFLEEFRGTVFRQTMFAEFELKIHGMAERNEPITAEAMCDVYEGLLRDYFGDDVEIDSYMRWEWARIPHFYNAFYVFKYATGFSAAVAITKGLLNGGAVDKYLDFLGAGGSDYPINTLRRAGVDMNTAAPVLDALDEFEFMLNELEQILLYNCGENTPGEQIELK